MNFETFYSTYKNDNLSKKETQLIYDEMDKDDYTDMGRSRYMDYDRMVKYVLENRKNKTLVEVKLVIVKESYPPQNVYEYKFE